MSKHSAEWAGAGMIPARNSVRESADVTDDPGAGRRVDRHDALPAAGPGLGDVQAQTLEIAVNEATLLKRRAREALEDAAAKATTAWRPT